jgi:hypothetical protein
MTRWRCGDTSAKSPPCPTPSAIEPASRTWAITAAFFFFPAAPSAGFSRSFPRGAAATGRSVVAGWALPSPTVPKQVQMTTIGHSRVRAAKKRDRADGGADGMARQLPKGLENERPYSMILASTSAGRGWLASYRTTS